MTPDQALRLLSVKDWPPKLEHWPPGDKRQWHPGMSLVGRIEAVMTLPRPDGSKKRGELYLAMYVRRLDGRLVMWHGWHTAAEPEPGQSAMDPQIPMANHTFRRHGARPTAAAAAVQALPRSGTQRARVYEAIRQAGAAGLTDQEIAVKLGLTENSVRPRRLELSDPPRQDLPRLIVDSGRQRQTSTGKPAVVWVAVEHAEEVARGA